MTQKKATLRKIHGLYEQLIKSTNAFGDLRQMAFQVADADFQDALTIVDESFERINDNDKKRLNAQVNVAATKAFQKLRKDQDSILELPDSEELLLTTNRRSESVFATYKGLEKFFVSMNQERLEVLTRARVNKVNLYKLNNSDISEFKGL